MHAQSEIVKPWMMALSLAAVIFAAQACDNAAPPPPATSSSSADGGSLKKKHKSGDDDDSTQNDSGDSSLGGQGGTSGTTTTGSSITEPTTFQRPGADVGEAADKKAVSDCNAKGTFYARFDDTPACKTAALAKVDCTLDGIRAALTAAGKNTLLNNFNTMIASDVYASKKIDQCVDCPAGNAIAYCKTGTPPKNGGTQIWFVSSDGTTVKGSAVMLSIRPYTEASSSTTTGAAATTTGSASSTTTGQ